MKMLSWKPLALACLVAFSARSVSAQNLITPDKVIPLFNGRDLSAFNTWLVDYHHDDPERVYSVVDRIDGAPAIRISGQYHGGLITKEHFTNYRLVAEFRWGALTWGARKDRARDAGILVHCQGPYGNCKKDFNSPWMRSYEFQIIEGGTGDLLVLGGYDQKDGPLIKAEITATLRDNKSKVWQTGGTPTLFTSGRVDWYGRDPQWKDTFGFRGQNDVEKPTGEWNHAEVVCDGDSLHYFLNGVLVNEATHASMRGGALLFQSEGAEIYFRRIELHPLKP